MLAIDCVHVLVHLVFSPFLILIFLSGSQSTHSLWTAHSKHGIDLMIVLFFA